MQETFLRAWRSRDTFDGGTLYRAWLYRIATNVCLDALRRRSRRLTAVQSFAEVPWLQPYPDVLLDEIAPSDEQPDAIVVDRETIELVFVAALQVLPPRQRAALVAATCSGGRRTNRRSCSIPASPRPTAPCNTPAPRCSSTSRRAARSGPRPSSARRNGRCSSDSSTRTSAATPPPRSRSPARTFGSRCRRLRSASRGSTPSAPLLATAFGVEREGDWRLVPTQANRMPAAASYLRRWGDSEFRAFKLDVLRSRRRSHRRDHDVRVLVVPRVRPAARARGVRGRGRRGRDGRRSPPVGDRRPPPTVAAR